MKWGVLVFPGSNDDRDTIYALGAASLSRLCARAGDAEGAREYARRAERARRSLVDKCYDDSCGLFFDAFNYFVNLSFNYFFNSRSRYNCRSSLAIGLRSVQSSGRIRYP